MSDWIREGEGTCSPELEELVDSRWQEIQRRLAGEHIAETEAAILDVAGSFAEEQGRWPAYVVQPSMWTLEGMYASDEMGPGENFEVGAWVERSMVEVDSE